MKLPITDPQVIRLATLTAAHDQIQAQIAAGKMLDVSGMLAIDNALAEVRAALKPMPQIDIRFVRRSFEVCPRCKESQPFTCVHCGHEETTDDYDRRREGYERRMQLPPAIEAKPESAPAPSIEGHDKPSPTNAVELPRRNPGSIHDQAGALLQTNAEPWRGR